jgi:hypothetical protein
MTPTQLIIIGLIGFVSPRLLFFGLLAIGLFRLFFS